MAERATKGDVVEVNGRNLLLYNGSAKELDSREQVRGLGVKTLEAVINYLVANNDEIDENSTIHVVNESLVEVIEPYDDKNNRHNVKLHATPMEIDALTTFLNTHHSIEKFTVGVQQMFMDEADRSAMLGQVGLIVSGVDRTDSDDGVSQIVQVRAGIERMGNEKLKNPVRLVPRRSFPEIDLDPVPFVLRVKSHGPETAPTVGLFEADGGYWKIDAISKINAFLTAENLGYTILA